MDRLLPLLYSCPGDAKRWSEFVERLTREVGAVQGLFVHHDRRDKNTDLSFGYNLDPAWAQAYADYYQYLNPYLALPQSCGPDAGPVALLSGLIEDSVVEASEFFADYVVPQGVTVRNAIRVIANETEHRSTAIALHRSQANCAADMGSALELCTYLLPHLRAAIELHDRLSSLEAHVALLERSLDRLPFGSIILTPGLRIKTVNARAEDILARNDGLSLSKGYLRAMVPAETKAMHHWMHKAAGLHPGDCACIGGHLRISRRERAVPYEAFIFPLFEQDSLSSRPDRGVAFLVTDSEQGSDSPLVLLRQRYGLSPAEERVALLLMEGWDVKEIAESLQVSRETVRSQLKAIFRKTGTRRQGELISRILRGDAVLAARMASIG